MQTSANSSIDGSALGQEGFSIEDDNDLMTSGRQLTRSQEKLRINDMYQYHQKKDPFSEVTQAHL